MGQRFETLLELALGLVFRALLKRLCSRAPCPERVMFQGGVPRICGPKASCAKDCVPRGCVSRGCVPGVVSQLGDKMAHRHSHSAMLCNTFQINKLWDSPSPGLVRQWCVWSNASAPSALTALFR